MDTISPDRTPADPPAAGDRQQDPLDLDAYCARIGYTGSLAVGPYTLTALHRAHVTAIPFENLDVLLGRGTSVELPAIQAKLVRAGRGGYCYEHGQLFAAVLEQLGFQVERMLARNKDPAVDPRPRAHLVLRIRLGDTVWLADTGFGSGLLEPVPLADSGHHRQGGWTFRVRRGDDGGWRLQEWRSEQWETLYTVVDEATYPVDIAIANYLTSTSPNSPFVRQVTVTRKDDRQLRELIDREYTVTRPDGTRSTRTVPDADLGGVLTELGMPMLPADVATLVAYQPPAAP